MISFDTRPSAMAGGGSAPAVAVASKRPGEPWGVCVIGPDAGALHMTPAQALALAKQLQDAATLAEGQHQLQAPPSADRKRKAVAPAQGRGYADRETMRARCHEALAPFRATRLCAGSQDDVPDPATSELAPRPSSRLADFQAWKTATEEALSRPNSGSPRFQSVRPGLRDRRPEASLRHVAAIGRLLPGRLARLTCWLRALWRERL